MQRSLWKAAHFELKTNEAINEVAAIKLKSTFHLLKSVSARMCDGKRNNRDMWIGAACYLVDAWEMPLSIGLFARNSQLNFNYEYGRHFQ